MTDITIPTKATSGTLTAAEFNQLLDALKDGTRTINSEAIKIAGTALSASDVSDFDTEVSNNSSVVANSAKVSYPGSADANELNILDGATVTTAELNYVDGVTSSIQTQLNTKAAASGDTIVVADHGTASTDQVVNVCYGTSASPPTASTTTEGTLYVQYTA